MRRVSGPNGGSAAWGAVAGSRVRRIGRRLEARMGVNLFPGSLVRDGGAPLVTSGHAKPSVGRYGSIPIAPFCDGVSFCDDVVTACSRPFGSKPEDGCGCGAETEARITRQS